MQLSEQRQILQSTFSFLRQEDIELLLDIAEYKLLKNKQVQIEAGSTSQDLFFILKGMIRGYFFNEKGEEKNIFLRPEHTITGAPESLFRASKTKYTFEAVSETHLLVFQFKELQDLGFQNPRIIQLILEGYQENIQTLIGRVESLINQAPEERYQALLKRSPQFFEKAYNKHVANYLGITAVSLSRIMKRKNNKKP